jgi:hypothetical protein
VLDAHYKKDKTTQVSAKKLNQKGEERSEDMLATRWSVGFVLRKPPDVHTQ